MPITPLHWSIAYLLREIRSSFSLPALIVSTAMPDLEIPFIYIITGGQLGRLVLHSLLGAAVIATMLSVIFTVFAYPLLISFLFRIDPTIVKNRCQFSWSLVAVCLLGSVSHVLVDSLHHEYNPLLFPFTYNSFDNFVLLNDYILASAIVQILFFVLLVFFVAKEVRHRPKNIWVRLFVE